MNETIKAFLENNRIGVLSVVLPDGSVDSASMHYAHSETPLEFIYMTDRSSRKCRAFTEGPAQASFVIGFDPAEMITVQMEGTALIVSDPEPLDRVKDVYYTKFPNRRKSEDDPDGAVIVFTPRSTRYSEYKKYPPTVLTL